MILSVAAINDADELVSFSNWGTNTVDIAAPGVRVFSTVPDNRYKDTVIGLPQLPNIPGLPDFSKFPRLTWDGTSMAAPHVAGAAALYLSKNPDAPFSEVKDALIRSAAPISAMTGKSVSEGKLDVRALMDL